MRTELAAGVFFDMADFLHIFRGENRLRDLEADRRIDVGHFQQVRLRPDERQQGHHHLLADRIDRRIGDLREQLLEIIIKLFQLAGQHRQRTIVAH